MKKLTFLFALLCASVMAFATQYCGETLTATDGVSTVTVTCTNPTTDTYVMEIVGGDNFAGFIGEGNYFELSGVGGNQVKNTTSEANRTCSFNESTKTLTVTLTSNATPKMYTPLYLNINGEKQFSALQNQVFEWPASCSGGSTPDPTPEGEKFVAANASIDHTYFANWEWAPETNSNAEYNSTTGELSVHIDNDKNVQWYAQVHFALGFEYVADKYYDFSIKFHADKAVNGITLKTNDDVEMFYENQSVNLPADEDFVFTKSDVLGKTGNNIFVFDFGHASANSNIVISEISIIEKDEPTPEPGEIDWTSEAWIGNASGNAAYTDKFKMSGHSCVNIQSPGFATAAGMYINDFAAPISYCSLGAGNYDVQGGGMILHADAFTAQVTEVAVVANHVQYIFYVYYADGTGTSNLVDPAPARVYDTNFALEANGGYASANSGNAWEAIDNNNGSRWESAASDPQIWTLDMSQRRIFNTVQIRWEGAYGKTFTIDVSNDGETWTTVKTVTDQVLAGFPYEQTLEFDEQTARFVRFNGTARGTGYGYSFWEFRVLLPGVSTLTSIDLSAAAAIAAVGGAGVALTAQPKDQNGQNMEEAVSYEISPAAAGHMSGNTYIPDQVGNASIRAYNGDIYSNTIVIAGYSGSNVALNKEVEASGYDTGANLYPSFAVDNDEGSLWSARTGETGDERIYDAWIVVDLGDFYDINLIAIRWEGACSRHYHVDFSEDNSTWRTAYDAGWNAVATHWEYLVGTEQDNTKVHYVRIWSTEAVSQYGIKIMDLKVFGTEWVDSGDTEAPVMTSASLVSSKWSSAVIAVAATDNVEVTKYHVVNTTPAVDVKLVPADGKITVTGLSAETEYKFAVTAMDAANNESANSIAVAVTTPVHHLVPTTVAPVPTWPDDQVKSLYSDTYTFAPASLNSYNEGWWDPPTMTEEAVAGNHYLHYNLYRNGMIGVQFAEIAVANMEKIHIDIYSSEDGSVRFRPITVGGPGDAVYKTLNLQAEQWNSFDIDMSDFPGHVWTKLYQYAFQGFAEGDMVGKHISIDNVYFYRETPIVDDEAPTSLTAALTATGLYSVTLTVQAEDNSGSVNFSVRNGASELATGTAATATATAITVNGLSSGTAYSLNVVALDDAGNETAPVVINATTRSLPASAPAPAFGNKVVVPVFTDAMAGGVSFSWGGWSEATVAQMLQLNTSDRAFHVSKFNYIGWHSFPAIDVSDMLFLHVDIYSFGMTSMGITPISPNHELSTSQTLTPNAWTSLDIPLSVYASANIDWTNVFQFKFDSPVDGNEALIDNVYFWRYGITSNVDRWASFAAAENLKVPSGVTVYKAVYSNEGGDEVLNLTDAGSVIPAGTGVLLRSEDASTPYGFTTATSGEASDAAGNFTGNCLVGCVTRTDISSVLENNDVFCLRRSDLYEMTGFFLYTGQYIPAGKAYLKLSKEGAAPAPARRIRLVVDAENTATAIDAASAVSVTKFVRDGQLFIRRGDAVYTVQGTRVK